MEVRGVRYRAGGLITTTPGQNDHRRTARASGVELESRTRADQDWPSSQAGWFDRRLGVSSIGVNRLADQPFCGLLEIQPEIRVQVGKLPPYHGIEKASRRSDHDRRRALPRISEWPNAIAPAQGDEQPDRPLVWQAELHLDGGIATTDLLKLGLQPLCCGFCGVAFSRRGRAEIQRLHLPQPIAKLVFDPHALAPRK